MNKETTMPKPPRAIEILETRRSIRIVDATTYVGRVDLIVRDNVHIVGAVTWDDLLIVGEGLGDTPGDALTAAYEKSHHAYQQVVDGSGRL